MKNHILKTSIVATAKDQVWCELAGEAVILNLKSGVYYGLSPVGARVWSLIQEPKIVSAVLDMLLEEYEVVCFQDDSIDSLVCRYSLSVSPLKLFPSLLR